METQKHSHQVTGHSSDLASGHHARGYKSAPAKLLTSKSFSQKITSIHQKYDISNKLRKAAVAHAK